MGHPDPPSSGTITAPHAQRETPTPMVMVLDDSYRGDLAVVGGFIVERSRLVELSTSWQDLKRSMSLEPTDELKFNLQSKDPARRKLDRRGWTVKERQPHILNHIANMNLKLVADVVHAVKPGLEPQAVWLDAFSWLLRWFANEIEIDRHGIAGPHEVWIDNSPSPPKKLDAASDRIRAMFDDKDNAAHRRYSDLWHLPQRFRRSSARPLRELDFVDSLHQKPSSCSDLVQIADFVAGCVRSFAHYNLNEGDNQPLDQLPEPGHPDRNMQILGPHFRRNGYTGQVLRYGLDLFPRNHPRTDMFRVWVETACAPQGRSLVPPPATVLDPLEMPDARA
jgi:hypothetical protein